MAEAQLVLDAEVKAEDVKEKVKPRSVKNPPVEPVEVKTESNGKAESKGEAESNGNSESNGEVESNDPPKVDPMIFVFTPTEGDDRENILLPLDFSKPDFNNPLDRIWLFDLGDLPPHERMWVWLRRAQLPRMTAHRIVALPLDEQVRCIETWLSAAQGVGAGE